MHTCFGAHPGCYQMGVGVSFLGGKAARECSWLITSIQCQCQQWVELCCLCGVDRDFLENLWTALIFWCIIFISLNLHIHEWGWNLTFYINAIVVHGVQMWLSFDVSRIKTRTHIPQFLSGMLIPRQTNPLFQALLDSHCTVNCD